MTDTEQHFVLGIAYQAGRRSDTIKRGMDGGRDFFTPEELERACHSFAKSLESGVNHGPDDTLGHANIVESYIYRGPDWSVGDVIVKSGDWLVGAILDDWAWDLAKRGEFTGWSMQGKATRLRRAE